MSTGKVQTDLEQKYLKRIEYTAMTSTNGTYLVYKLADGAWSGVVELGKVLPAKSK